MFQGIYYNRNKNHPKAWHYFLRDDKAGIKSFSYYPTVYKLDEEGEFETLFGDRCTAINGRYDKTDPNILEKDISKELVLLRDLYHETDDIPSYHNIVYLDIEIEIIGPLNPVTIKEANAEITSIALIDASTKEKVCFILDKKQEIESIVDGNKHIVSCVSEKDLIKKFLLRWEQMDPTIVIGWNSDYFDLPYLYYRISKELGIEVNRLSPVGIVDENPYKPESPITIALVSSLDYMHLFKKYIAKQEASYKLGDIGLKYANLGKVEYNGSLDKLFLEDKQKFIDYNLRDCEILEALEEKQKFIELTILISHICHTPYESIHYNTILNEAAILTYLKRKNIIAPNKPTTTNPSIKELEKGEIVENQRGTPTIEGIVHEIKDNYVTIITSSNKFISRNINTIKKKEGYAGGFLLEIKPGLYDWLSDFDYSSLYPSIIRSLNLSIENLVGRIVIPNQNYNSWCSLIELEEMDPEEVILVQKLNKNNYTIVENKTTVKNILNIIKSQNMIVSANGTIYDSTKRSIIAEILSDWFDLRKQYKNMMKEAYKKDDKETGELYNQKQHSLKILLNSVYGTFAINSWRFTDGYKMCSSSITTTGQRFIMETIKYADETIRKEYFS